MDDTGNPALVTHQATVNKLSRQIGHFYQTQTPYRVFHGNTNSTRPSLRTLDNTVDITSLNNVISVDTVAQTCLVEPNVPMDLLVASTLGPHGLVCPVVPEFPGITVGGGFAGTAGESTSFRHGFFDRCVESIEIILGDGEVLRVSRDDPHGRADLFQGAAGTFGTLGLVTLFEIRLVQAKPYVKLTYLPVASIVDAQDVLREQAEDQTVEFLDGIMFGPDRGVLMAGRFADRGRRDQPNGHVDDEDDESDNSHLPIVTFSKAWDQWFYLHAEERMVSSLKAKVSADAGSQVQSDMIPLTDYLFRYDRGAFWTGSLAYKYFVTPFNRVTRYLLDGFMHTRVMYHALHRSGLMQRFIIQDMAVPNKNMAEFSSWLDQNLPHIYPRWLCPLKLDEAVSLNPHNAVPARVQEDVLLNIGVWGMTPSDQTQIGANRRIEKKLKDVGGMKWLYAQTFYTEDEFWNIYDRPWYESLRLKYKAQALPNVYEKVRTKVEPEDLKNGSPLFGVEKGFWSIWPLAGLYGVASVLKGGTDYLRKG
ncbi:hypothetical protein PV10_00064 [Exophiala mesophila]|uniref:Delta(24)-sterol reductase n=1 Tax=Exophiala mesophila TaxID=212818 RepID=A0A0D1ZNF2_EXOME|nr:uncharacterized protein PV10_00064 [Exophiala mesophila]KIV96162.1 hypothetical protein PV10_00064 [Exophiala mesophila]